MRDAELHLTKQTFGNGVVTLQTFDADTGRLTGITAGEAAAVQSHTYTYDPLGKLLTRSDANTGLSETFGYDTLNRLTSSTVSLSPSPWVQTIAYNAIGNITSKSDVGTYSYPAPGQPRPHGVTSISGGTINTTFQYDAKGNMISGNGLTVAYTSFNKPTSITRGTTTIAFDHDPEHQRFSQFTPSGIMLYLAGGGVFAGIGGGGVQWTNDHSNQSRWLPHHRPSWGLQATPAATVKWCDNAKEQAVQGGYGQLSHGHRKLLRLCGPRFERARGVSSPTGILPAVVHAGIGFRSCRNIPVDPQSSQRWGERRRSAVRNR